LFVALFRPDPIEGAWQGLVDSFSVLWSAVGTYFTDTLAMYGRFVDLFVPTGVIAAWQQVSGFFSDLWATVTGAFERAWAVIEPIIDAINAAVGPVIRAAERIASIGSTVVGAAYGAGQSVLRTGRSAAESVGAGVNRLFPGPVEAAQPGPLQQGLETLPQATTRVDGEVETRIVVSLDPGLTGTATTNDTGRVNSTVNVGTSMVPA
jgi:hypothetical protein